MLFAFPLPWHLQGRCLCHLPVSLCGHLQGSFVSFSFQSTPAVETGEQQIGGWERAGREGGERWCVRRCGRNGQRCSNRHGQSKKTTHNTARGGAARWRRYTTHLLYSWHCDACTSPPQKKSNVKKNLCAKNNNLLCN